MALLYMSTISFCLLGSSTTDNYTNFEQTDCVFDSGEITVRLAFVDRSPLSKDNCSTIHDFLDQ